jgi:flagellar motor switch protein FliG
MHLMGMSKDETEVIDGPRVAAMILNRLPSEARTRLVSALRAANPEAAVKIEQIMVHELAKAKETPAPSLAALADMDDRDVQKLLRQVDSRDLVLTLKSAPVAAQEKVLQNLSQSRQQQVLEEIHDLERLSPSEVEAANTRILKKIDSLYPGQNPSEPQRKRLRSRLA